MEQSVKRSPEKEKEEVESEKDIILQTASFATYINSYFLI
jgi:hypothetical protein